MVKNEPGRVSRTTGHYDPGMLAGVNSVEELEHTPKYQSNQLLSSSQPMIIVKLRSAPSMPLQIMRDAALFTNELHY